MKSHFSGAYSTIKSIRESFLCEYPIEIWSYGSEIKRLPTSAIAAFDSIPNVTIHALEEPQTFTNIKEEELDWYQDYVGFSTMARAIWSTDLAEVGIKFNL